MIASLFDLTGRTALVTGSSKGIGFALAGAWASAGARVVLNARDAGRLEAARTRLVGEGFQVEAVPFDVTDSDAVHAGVAAIEGSAAWVNWPKSSRSRKSERQKSLLLSPAINSADRMPVSSARSARPRD